MSDQDNICPPRKRGAPKGNRNAWKHGGRSAAAKAAREASRAARLAHLPDAELLRPHVQSAKAANGAIAREAGIPKLSTNKTNNSAPQKIEGEGTPLPCFPTDKTNNSANQEEPRQRGAPKGNHNALKHGMRSSGHRSFRAELRLFLKEVRATSALAHMIGRFG